MERLARLQRLRDAGFLSHEEIKAKRQVIVDRL